MPKISALTSLAQADVVTTTDVLPIVDATAPATTKKVTVQAMVNAGLATLTTLPSGIVNASLNSITPAGDTLAVTGSISATATAETFISTAATTSPRSLHLANTGGDVYFGIEGSSSGGFFNGSTAYATVVYSTQRVQTIIIGVKRTEVDSSGLSVTGSISATGNITSAGNVIQVGAAGTGTGGNYRITDDGGTLRWLAGLLGTAGARDWTLLEVVSGRTPIRANASTGAVSIDHGLSVTGSISATSLVDISAAGAGQIKFPATQNASADANTLDDYEEGSWTPTITFGGASTGVTYSTQGGSYTKVGNRVTVSGRVALTNKGSATGDAAIGGLPFTVGAGSDAYAIPGLFVDVITFTGIVQGATTLASTSIFLGQSTEAGATSALTDANFANNSNIAFSLTYKI